MTVRVQIINDQPGAAKDVLVSSVDPVTGQPTAGGVTRLTYGEGCVKYLDASQKLIVEAVDPLPAE